MSILLHKIPKHKRATAYAAALLLFIGNVLRTLSDDIRSPLAYAYAELNAHGARHARPLSFARMEVLRTSQEEKIELSLSLDFLRFAQSKRATAYAAALFAFAEYVFRTCTGLLEHLLLIAVFLLKFVICINGIII